MNWLGGIRLLNDLKGGLLTSRTQTLTNIKGTSQGFLIKHFQSKKA